MRHVGYDDMDMDDNVYIIESDHTAAMAELQNLADANAELYSTELLRTAELQAKCERMKGALRRISAMPDSSFMDAKGNTFVAIARTALTETK
jgi:hypothetical protein